MNLENIAMQKKPVPKDILCDSKRDKSIEEESNISGGLSAGEWRVGRLLLRHTGFLRGGENVLKLTAVCTTL